MTDAMRSMEQAAQRPAEYHELVALHEEPAKLRENLIVVADGTDWDPGEGPGIYHYTGSAWEKLIKASDVTTYTGIGDSAVEVTTGNGSGSANTKVRRFSTVVLNAGTAITYSDSSTLGSKFAINEDGLYYMEWSDVYASAGFMGISLDASSGSTAVQSLAYAERIAMNAHASAVISRVTYIAYLVQSNAIRPHAGTTVPTGTSDLTRFVIRKIGI